MLTANAMARQMVLDHSVSHLKDLIAALPQSTIGKLCVSVCVVCAPLANGPY